jgi:glycosyltransferase involved in cell wall biosynthesis
MVEVSVVMGVYNGGHTLAETLDSVLSQEDCELECIVVNDGSTDDTGRILAQRAARDARLRILDQPNAGLTRALIRGCSEARGEFIARQDAGDISMPGRLARQVQALRADGKSVAVTCHTQFVGPKGEPLYVSRVDEDELNESMRTVAGPLRGPSHHGSVTMRRSAYVTAGGYRPQFYFAQDLDLWTRIVEQGRLSVMHEVLYRARLEPGAISGTHSAEQRLLAGLIAEAARMRRSGGDESAFLAGAARVQPVRAASKSARLARGNYFIGSCLLRSAPSSARAYFGEAIRHDPTHWRAWVRWLQASVRS